MRLGPPKHAHSSRRRRQLVELYGEFSAFAPLGVSSERCVSSHVLVHCQSRCAGVNMTSFCVQPARAGDGACG